MGLSDVWRVATDGVTGYSDPEDWAFVVPLGQKVIGDDAKPTGKQYAYAGDIDGKEVDGEDSGIKAFREKDFEGQSNVLPVQALSDKGFAAYKNQLTQQARALCSKAGDIARPSNGSGDFTGDMADIRQDVRNHYRGIQVYRVSKQDMAGDGAISSEQRDEALEKTNNVYEALDKMADKIDAVREITPEQLKQFREDFKTEVENSGLVNKDQILNNMESGNVPSLAPILGQ